VNRRGAVLPLTLLLVLALGAVAAAASVAALTSARIAHNGSAYERVFSAAEGALDRSASWLVSAYAAGSPPADSAAIPGGALGAASYRGVAAFKREPRTGDLNGNGVRGEVVRYDRSWGYGEAVAAGGPLDPGEPVRVIRASAAEGPAFEELALEIAIERDSAVADPSATAAWRTVRLRWSSAVGHR
jgi:hypothetical protein